MEAVSALGFSIVFVVAVVLQLLRISRRHLQAIESKWYLLLGWKMKHANGLWKAVSEEA